MTQSGTLRGESQDNLLDKTGKTLEYLNIAVENLRRIAFHLGAVGPPEPEEVAVSSAPHVLNVPPRCMVKDLVTIRELAEHAAKLSSEMVNRI